MSNNRKKKPISFNKQEAAHYKKIYFQKIIEVAKAVSLNDSYKLLTPDMLETIFSIRSRLFKIVAPDCLNLNSGELQEMKEAIVLHLKSNGIQFESTGHELLLYDFAGPGLSLFTYLAIRKNESKKKAELVAAFEDFIDTTELLVNLQEYIYKITNQIGCELTRFDKWILSPTVSFKVVKVPSPYMYIEITLKVHQPETISLNINGNTRPVFRVGVTSDGSEVFWSYINAEILGVSHLAPGTQIPVYIQHHAINRLKERIDCADNTMVLLNLVNSLNEAKCIIYHGNKLIEFIFSNQKIGYLLIDLVNDIAVIRTFLMLTHFDTPEGDVFHKLIGLEKLDISYLTLDKLSTFVFSEIKESDMISDLFSQSGCKSLLDVPKKEFGKEKYKFKAAAIETYLLKYQEYKEQFNFENLFS